MLFGVFHAQDSRLDGLVTDPELLDAGYLDIMPCCNTEPQVIVRVNGRGD